MGFKIELGPRPVRMYTTDAVPTSSSSPTGAWLVWTSEGRLSTALSKLEEEAREKGADAIVGLRICPPVDTGKYGAYSFYCVYGTAVKHA